MFKNRITLFLSIISAAVLLLFAIGCTPDSDELSAGQQTPTPPVISDIHWALIHTVVGGDAVVPAPAEAGAYLEIIDGQAGGSAGCNRYNGSVTLNGNNISFGPLASTRMACEEARMAVEAALLDALQRAVTFHVDGDTLELRDADGLSLALFARANVQTLYVGPALVDCVGVAPQQCLQVKSSPDAAYELFYGEIAGFVWEAGYEYELRVAVSEVANPPADGSSLRYTLVEFVNQTPVSGDGGEGASDTTGLVGPLWQWLRFEGGDGSLLTVNDPTRYTIRFLADGNYELRADCNSGSGTYTVEGSSIVIAPGPITLMGCPEDSLDGQFISRLLDTVTFVFDDAGNLVLNIKMDAGNMVFAAQ